MFRRKPKAPRRTYACPNCGDAVREGALACPSCGSDTDTGWSDDAGDVWPEDLGGYGADDDGSEWSPEAELRSARTVNPVVVLVLLVVAVVVLVFS
jgi:hypothetical protein